MDKKLEAFIKLAESFKQHGHQLYLVGGTVRDYLLGEPLTDMDAVTDALPEEVISFLPSVDTTFIKYGSLKYKDPDGLKFDITTLRKESLYRDARHPEEIVFVKDLKEDFPRRDFTINALYMDQNLKVIDYCQGQIDLKNKILKMVGDPFARTKEDPLRILRAIRFALMHDLTIEETLLKAMHENFSLIKKVTDAKIRSELNKIDDSIVDQNKKKAFFQQFDIANLVGVIK